MLIDALTPTIEELKPQHRGFDPRQDFLDLVSSITELSVSPSGSLLLKVEGRLNETHIGFLVEILDGTSRIVLGNDGTAQHINAFPRGVAIRTLGESSDSLWRMMGQMLASDKAPKKMVDEIVFTSLALTEARSDIRTSPVSFKLFYDRQFVDPESEEARRFYADEYFEYYLNVDVSSGLVYFKEKDPEYRQATLQAFTRKEGNA